MVWGIIIAVVTCVATIAGVPWLRDYLVSFQSGPNTIVIVPAPKAPSIEAQRSANNSTSPPTPSPLPPTPSPLDFGQAGVLIATIHDGTDIQLPTGHFYIYGFATGGGAASTPFMVGEYANAKNAAGQLAVSLAYGSNNQNSYTTRTGYHVVGGVCVGGRWKNIEGFYGSNSDQGASVAAASFKVTDDSLVVVIGTAASQQGISLQGIPDLQVDALNSGPAASEAMIIAHSYLRPGSYTVIQHSEALSAGQDRQHMAVLVGVFVFSSKV